MTKRIALGLIGAGKWGKNYLKTCDRMSNVQIRCVCTRTKQSARALAKQYPTITTTTNHNDLLCDDTLHGIIIATPGTTHYKLSKEALLQGKHVLVEKPGSILPKEITELTRIAKQKKRVFMVGYVHLFNPVIQKIKEILPKIGKLRYIHYIHKSPGFVRSDMSALYDFHPHFFSMILALTPLSPTHIHASGAKYGKHHDLVNVTLYGKNNTYAQSLGTWLHPQKEFRISIAGEKGYILFDEHADNKLQLIQGKKQKNISYSANMPLTNEVQHFIDCIHTNKKPISSGTLATKVVKLTHLANSSLQKNTTKKVQLS